MASVSVAIPLGALLKKINPNAYIHSATPGPTSKRYYFLTNKPDRHSLASDLIVFGVPGYDQLQIKLDDTITAALDKAVAAYDGKQIKDMPDWVTVDLPKAPELAKPFEEILPGIPNPGVNPTTGETPVDYAWEFLFGGRPTPTGQTQGSFDVGVLPMLNGFFQVLLGLDYVRIAVVLLAAFLLWKGYQMINNEGQGDTKPQIQVMPLPV